MPQNRGRGRTKVSQEAESNNKKFPVKGGKEVGLYQKGLKDHAGLES